MGFIKYLFENFTKKIRTALLLFGLVLFYPGMLMVLISNPAPAYHSLEAWIPFLIGLVCVGISVLTALYCDYYEKSTGKTNWWE